MQQPILQQKQWKYTVSRQHLRVGRLKFDLMLRFGFFCCYFDSQLNLFYARFLILILVLSDTPDVTVQNYQLWNIYVSAGISV